MGNEDGDGVGPGSFERGVGQPGMLRRRAVLGGGWLAGAGTAGSHPGLSGRYESGSKNM